MAFTSTSILFCSSWAMVMYKFICSTWYGQMAGSQFEIYFDVLSGLFLYTQSRQRVAYILRNFSIVFLFFFVVNACSLSDSICYFHLKYSNFHLKKFKYMSLSQVFAKSMAHYQAFNNWSSSMLGSRRWWHDRKFWYCWSNIRCLEDGWCEVW